MPTKSSKLFWISITSLVIALFVIAVLKYRNASQEGSPHATPFSVVAKVFFVSERNEGLILYGRTEPFAKVDIEATPSGFVKEIVAKDGTLVHAKAPLITIDPENQIFDLSRAKARRDHANLDYQTAKSLEKSAFETRLHVARAYADLQHAEAEVAALERELGRTSVKAPLEGIFMATSAQVGDFLKPGEKIGEVICLNPLKIVTFIAEDEYSRVPIDSPCKITILDGKIREGIVRYKAPLSSNKIHTYEVRIEMQNPDHALPAGLSATVEIPMVGEKVMVLPASVLTLNDEGALGVKVVDEKSTVRFLTVKILSGDHKNISVLGVPDAARVIVRGHDFVQEGQIVTVSLLTDTADTQPPPKVEKNAAASTLD